MIDDMTPTPNALLISWRRSQRLTQEELARRIRQAGEMTGDRNTASQRTIQRWERGEVTRVQTRYARALEVVTGMPVQSLGLNLDVRPDGTGGHDVRVVDPPPASVTAPRPAPGSYGGIWLSSYGYYSGRRERAYEGRHFVLLTQAGPRLLVRSIQTPELPGNRLSMDLDVDGTIVTGTWREETRTDGYYRGAVYHGAVQMIISPTGGEMVGKWVGFSRELKINSGPWRLEFRTADTSDRSLREYARDPDREK